jgi:hypothetical protein
MKITKSQLQQVIREAVQEEYGYESGAARADREMYLSSIGEEVPVEIGKLQTMLYRLEDDFMPFLMNSSEREIGEAVNQLYKLLKARVEG